MGQILRHHTGTLTIPVRLLTDIEHALSMDSADPADTVAPLYARLQAQWATGSNEVDESLVAALHDHPVHDYLTLAETHAVQQLRGWHRLRAGTIEVDARWLSRVRNVFDTLTLTWSDDGCEELLAELEDDESAERDLVAAAVSAGQMCLRCESCSFLLMRDLLDATLDAAGFRGGPWHDACGPTPPLAEAQRLWTERTAASAAA